MASRWLPSSLVTLLILNAGCALVLKKPSSEMLSDAQRLLKAAAQGDVQTLREKLNDGTDVDTAGPGGTTSLMVSAYRGHADVVEILLSRGARLELRDDIGQTALHHAALAGKGDTTRLLLAAGAQPELFSAMGLTPLMLAARYGDMETITRLLAAGAKASTVDPTGWTAVFFCIARGNKLVYERLLQERDVDLKHQDIDGNSLLHIAVLYGQSQFFHDLVRRGTPQGLRDKRGQTARQMAGAMKVSLE